MVSGEGADEEPGTRLERKEQLLETIEQGGATSTPRKMYVISTYFGTGVVRIV